MKKKKYKKQNKQQFIYVYIIFFFIIVFSSFLGSFMGVFYYNNILYFKKNNLVNNKENKNNIINNNDITENISAKNIVKNIKDSVVEIKTSFIKKNFNENNNYIIENSGSGIILTENGYIVTNSHIINKTDKIIVKLNNGTENEAKIINFDKEEDLAILKIDAKNLKAVKIGDSEELSVGDYVLAIGNPLGKFSGTVTEGIISAKNRKIKIGKKIMNLIQTSAAINYGNSGGGLFNSKSELIGIINAKTTGISIEGIGFAIPSNTLINYIKKNELF